MSGKDDALKPSTYLLLTNADGKHEKLLVIESYLGSWDTKSQLKFDDVCDQLPSEGLTEIQLDSLQNALTLGPAQFQIAHEVEAFLSETGASVVRVSSLPVGGGSSTVYFEVRRRDGRTLEVTQRFEEAFGSAQVEEQLAALERERFELDDAEPAAEQNQATPRSPVRTSRP